MFPELFGPFRNRDDPEARQSAADARRSADNARQQVDRLRRDVNHLSIVVEAMWNMLEQSHGFTTEDLKQRITEIDMRDGQLDGQVKSTGPKPCPECGRPVTRNRPFCIYCGKRFTPEPFDR